MNDQVLHQLNQHPLNQAALRRLQAEGHRPLPGQLHLLDLAHLGLQQADGDLEDEDQNLLGDWQEHPESSLRALEQDLTEDLVERANLDRVGSQIRDSLKAQNLH